MTAAFPPPFLKKRSGLFSYRIFQYSGTGIEDLMAYYVNQEPKMDLGLFFLVPFHRNQRCFFFYSIWNEARR